ncbi:MAG TPA: hypothetical protein VN626_03490 [Clostridia bacterium]|nr:hypothetical protein [Clostridia bacterium]
MKKLFAVLLALGLVSALSLCAFAASRGAAYIEDNGYYDEKVSNATPGGTVYIALAEATNADTNYKISSSMIPTSAKITSAKTTGSVDDKDYKLIKTGSLDIEKLDVEDGSAWYFAVLKVQDIDINDYPEDGYLVSGTIKVTRKSGSTFTLDLNDALEDIRFAEAENEDELSKVAQIYSIKSSTEFELEFPNGKGRFSGKTKGAIEVLAAMNHTKISAITKLNKNAEMTFYIGNEAKFSNIKTPKLIIEADNGSYLYQIGNNNKLTNKSSTYDEDEDAFVIETNVLGKYVVSDEKLSTASTSSSSEEDEDSDDTYTYTEDNDDADDDASATYVPVPLINPATGAAV